MDFKHEMTEDALDGLVWLSQVNLLTMFRDAEVSVDAGDYLTREARERFDTHVSALLEPYRAASGVVRHQLEQYVRRLDDLRYRAHAPRRTEER